MDCSIRDEALIKHENRLIALILAAVVVVVLLAVFAPACEAAQHSANIVSVYDGDTVTADISIGFGVILAGQ